MAESVKTLVNYYNDVMVNHRDQRVDGWFMMSSPWPTAALCISYVTLVWYLGPRWMKNRPPFEFRKILVIYNAAQMIFSAWLFYKLGMGGWFRGYSYQCQPVDYSDDPMAVAMVHACWWYYFSKFTEFFDTFFFVLRKKWQHVSTLHVVHHGIMPLSVWFGAKFTPGGHSSFFGLLNTFVHIIMYFYYMVAAMGPQYTKYLWWKRHLTNIQMVQFIMIFSHSFQLLFVDCNYPKGFMWWIGGHAVLFFILFSEYYYSAYISGRRQRLIQAAAAKEKGKVSQKNGFKPSLPCFLNGEALNGDQNGHIANGHVDQQNGVRTRSRLKQH